MASQTNTPTMGIMTRTLVSSSVIKSIIPARIRASEFNDVLFVSDDSIELQEYHSNGYLQHVARKADFGCKILSACCCFGEPSTQIKPEPSTSGGIDSIIELDRTRTKPNIEAIKAEFKDELDTFIGRKLEPPQILALVLESRELVFLLAHYDKYRAVVTFLTSSPHRHLYSGGTQATQPGRRIAIDPTSSILAIAPYEGHITLCQLSSLAQIHAELPAISLQLVEFDPVQAETTITIKGTILQMEFLYPKRGLQGADNPLVVLIVIVSRKGRTKLHRYEWDSSTGIENFAEVGTGHALSAEEQTPLFLIPVTITSGFLLVCQTRGFLYGDTSPGCWESPLPQMLNDQGIDGADTNSVEGSSEESGISHGTPIWTQWTRPVRRKDWFSTNDAIYLCREDGLVKYLLIEANGTRPTIAKSKVGNIKTNIDSALACIDNGLGGTWYDDGKESEDVLVTGDSIGDGALYSFKSRQNVIKGQVIPRWAPLLDVCTVPSIPTGVTLRPFEDPPGFNLECRPQQLFACTGRGARDGAVCELRYGTRASLSISYLRSASTLLGLWVFDKWPHSNTKDKSVLLLSGPVETHLMDEGGNIISTADCGFDNASQTIAAGCSMDDVCIQITRRSVRAFKKGAWGKTPFREDMDILAAHVHCFHALALLCVRDGKRNLLKLVHFQSKESGTITLNHIGTSLMLEAEITTLHLAVESGRVIALAGDRNHQLQVHLGTLENGLDTTFHRNFGDYDQNPSDPISGLCESLALIAGPNDAEVKFPLVQDHRYLVLCGLRNGRYEAHVISLEGEGVSFEEFEVRTIGQSVVKVMPETTSERRKTTERCHTRALILCDGILCRLSYLPHLPVRMGATFTRIWLVNHGEPGCRYSNITAIAQPIYFPNFVTKLEPKANLFCLEGGDVHCADLDILTEPQVLPRKLAIDGTPSRILYSQRLHKLIVGYDKTIIKDVSGPKSRLHFPMVTTIDPFRDFSNMTSETSLATSDLIVQNIGRSGEKILGIHEWCMTPHYAIVINTIQNRKGGKAPTGRILVYHVRIDEKGLNFKVKLALKQPAPVYALAILDHKSIVHCTGMRIVKHEKLLSSDGVTWKIQETAARELPSTGVAISAVNGKVFVSTKIHSTMVYRVEDNTFIPVVSDQVARNVSTHLVRESPPIVHVAGTNGILGGLKTPNLEPLNRSFITAYEAKLSSSITRLLAAHLQPLWYREHQEEGTLALASSLNGAIYQFQPLPKSTAICLKFIQNLVERIPENDASKVPPRRPHVMPSPNDALHVDGDVLARFLRLGHPGPQQRIRDMLLEPWNYWSWEDSGPKDPLADTENRIDAFEELVHDMNQGEDEDDEDAVHWVVDQITKFLRVSI